MSVYAVTAGLAVGAALAPVGVRVARRTVHAVLRRRHELYLASVMAVTGAVAASWEASLLAPAVLLVVLGVPAALVDVVEHRIPDRLSLPLAGGTLVTLACSSAPQQLLHAALGGAAWTALLLVTFIITGQPGPGDVKLAPSLGMLAGWSGWTSLITAITAAYLLAGLLALAGILSRQLTLRGGRLPLGPAMITATVLAVTLAH